MTSDPLADILAGFFAECEDLLGGLQDALAQMSDGCHDAETVNTVFRAVHSIKGGAAAFGLSSLVEFAHRFENVLDELRLGRLDLTPEAMAAFYLAGDMLQDQVHAARDAAAPPDAAAACHALAALACQPASTPAAAAFSPLRVSPELLATSGAGSAEDGARMPPPGGAGRCLRLTPLAAFYRSGNEALPILQELARLGASAITCHIPDDLSLSEADAEIPRLSWSMLLPPGIDDAALQQLLGFIEDVCVLELQAPAMTAPPGEPTGCGTEACRPSDGCDGDGLPAQDGDASRNDRHAAPPRVARDRRAGETPEAAADDTARPTASAPGALPATASPIRPAEPPATIRVDLGKIDRLVNLVGELAVSQAMLAQGVASAGAAAQQEVIAGFETLMTLTRDIQEGVMSIRAQPLKPLFQRMGRILRQAAASSGKEARLRLDGEFTEIDRTVIESLADPLTHMIRNAVDHGIEPATDRLAAGKPREGTITLSASHRAGRVIVEICDDGRGIDRDAVRRIAVQRGLVPADAELGDAELNRLLFAPGLSTSPELSPLSGRGVGMDVVHTAITALGGRVSIDTQPGLGTRFSISLPLTLAVLDGMVVQVAGHALVVPLTAILETAVLRDASIERLAAGGEMMPIRGKLVPLVDLGEALGFRKQAGLPRRPGIVLVTAQDGGPDGGQDGGGPVGLIVDAVMEQRHVVVKALSPDYARMSGIAAATILGDGRVALILDPCELMKTRAAPFPDMRLAG